MEIIMIQLSTILLLAFVIVSIYGYTPGQVRFQKETLRAHNQYRARHCAPPLRLDKKLNRVAQQYADYLASNNKFEHSKSGHGENLYMSYGSSKAVKGEEATKAWYDEIKKYRYNQPGFSMEVGHFTQLVWKDSKRMGVGIGRHGDRTVVVANYDPPGNYQGRFPQNVLQRKC